jgi:hypothetical protein
LQDAVDIGQYLIIPESEYTIIAFLDSPAAECIFRSGLLLTMLSPIELDYQMTLLATEVSDKGADLKLTAESRAIEASRAETMPENELGVGLLAPQSSCTRKFSVRRAVDRPLYDLSLTLSLDKERE